MSEISILIPSFKEYENLKFLLPQIYNSIKKNFTSHKLNVIVVDSIEYDVKTKSLCDKYGFIYINREKTDNFGDAIRTGIEYVNKNFSNSKWLIIMDSDGSHDSNIFFEFSKLINLNKFDLVIASRYIRGGSTENNLILKFLSSVVNLIYRKYFNLNIKDVSNNFRLYRFSLLKDIDLVEENFEVVEEILIKLLKNNPNLRISEIPSKFLNRKYGKSKRNLFRFSITYFKSILRLRRYIK